MRTRQDIEAYLIRTHLNFEDLGDDTWVVQDGSAKLVIRLAGPLVVFRVRIMDLPSEGQREALFRTLLELNAAEMVQCAYALSESAVVLACSLRLENLDFSEFQGTLDDFSMALSDHKAKLTPFGRAS